MRKCHLTVGVQADSDYRAFDDGLFGANSINRLGLIFIPSHRAIYFESDLTVSVRRGAIGGAVSTWSRTSQLDFNQNQPAYPPLPGSDGSGYQGGVALWRQDPKWTVEGDDPIELTSSDDEEEVVVVEPLPLEDPTGSRKGKGVGKNHQPPPPPPSGGAAAAVAQCNAIYFKVKQRQAEILEESAALAEKQEESAAQAADKKKKKKLATRLADVLHL